MFRCFYRVNLDGIVLRADIEDYDSFFSYGDVGRVIVGVCSGLGFVFLRGRV